ncbi:hypothetical protein Mcup_1534 [Metallosphaera cuprina Ar-4]|uniref:Uncharacterized protein n=1 Tax=Metallosphaera cuprina (strain Ar-4) TaxID=1006006 RepID=F4FZE7_METCR|nr:hypothetical protein Mcup_1534 [Metallosphaera cuprina Ar-4]
MGTKTVPPPRPVSEPRKPANMLKINIDKKVSMILILITESRG